MDYEIILHEYALPISIIVVGIIIGTQLIFTVFNQFFFIFNWLQYFLQRPHRIFIKMTNKSSNFKRVSHFLMWPFKKLVWLYLYIITTPLRILNALYYDIFVLNLWRIKDALSYFFYPKDNFYKYKSGFSYFLAWIYMLPIRIILTIWKVLFGILDGVTMVIVDTVFPTLTMFHGTSYSSAENITQPNKWEVGSGNYAGTGLYFGINKKTAKHYASGEVIIVCRVTLGRNLSLSRAPEKIRQSVGYLDNHGNEISKWGLNHLYTSIEHWRAGSNSWWEYCLLSKKKNDFMKTWRVRPLYVIGVKKITPKRIKDGMQPWLYNPASWGILVLAIGILFGIYYSTETEYGKIFFNIVIKITEIIIKFITGIIEWLIEQVS